MNEERLQEIKDSISLQYKVQEANELHNFSIFTNEEQELVEEIERLNNIINEIIKCIDSLYVPYEMEENWEFYGKEYDDREKVIEEIKKLKGSDKD